MIVHEEYVDIDTPTGKMRVHIFRPRVGEDSGAKFPGVMVYTEIYQVTGPLQRFCRLIASEGYIAACPESYHELEPLGSVIPYDAEGTDRGNLYKTKKPIEAFDTDAQALVKYLQAQSYCTGKLGTVGMCLGGHLALRAALEPEVICGVCLFATDVHKRSLGEKGDNTIDRLGELGSTELLMIFGKQDNHVPAEGRAMIHKALVDANADFQWCEFNAQHAFIRDEASKGRYDPALTKVSHTLMFELFGRQLTLGVGSSANMKPQATAAGPANC
eukprot:GFYU01018169.1.p1 GENE.GFYU01018169.1~~GFYU01018169.1.p1  ORF type:complete len:273 (-),score=48.68 GFYU01018169.1:66-884(-)